MEIIYKAKELITKLKGLDINECKDTLDALAEIGNPAMEYLIEAFNDTDWGVRIKIAMALGKFKDSRSVAVMSKAMKDDSVYVVQKEAARALVEIGKLSEEHLIEMLNDESKNIYDIKALAVWALGEIRDIHAIEALISTLRNNYKYWFNNRDIIVEAFVKIGNATVESLISLLKEEDEDYLYTVIDCLGIIGDRRAVDPLIHFLERTTRYKSTVAEALGKLRNPRAVEPLINILNDKHPYVRELAACALGRIKDDRAINPLISLLKDEEKSVRLSAVEALRKFKDIRAIEAFKTVLNDKDKRVRQRATRALGEIKGGGINAIENLTISLKDKSKYVRIKAAREIARIGGDQVAQVLISALNDNDHKVRKEITKLLGEIKSSQSIPFLLDALSDKNLDVRLNAIRSLEKIVDALGVDMLVSKFCSSKTLKAYSENDNFRPIDLIAVILNNKGGNLKGQVKIVFCEIKKVFEIDKLGSKLKSNYEEAIKELGKIDHPLAVRYLLNAFCVDNESIQFRAALELEDKKYDNTFISAFSELSGLDSIDWAKVEYNLEKTRVKLGLNRLMTKAIFKEDKEAKKLLENIFENYSKLENDKKT